MPVGKLKLGAVCAVLLAVLAIAGCGGDDAPEPSIPPDDARILIDTLDEVESNVDVGSCLVAEEKTQELQAQIDRLPPSVNDDVVDALQRGTLNLGELIADPTQCEAPRRATRRRPPRRDDDRRDDDRGDHHRGGDDHGSDHDDHSDGPDHAHHPAEPPDAGGGISPRETVSDGPRTQGRADLRPLPDRGPPRLRRDVERVPRDRHDPRADGRREDPRRAPLRRRALRRPLPPRGPRRREAGPPQHRPGLRHRQRLRPVLHRHGVREGQVGRPAAPVAGDARDRHRRRHRHPGLRRPRLRPPPRDHPPRRQAREPDGDRRPRRAAAT